MLGLDSLVATKSANPFSDITWLSLSIISVVGLIALYMTFSPLINAWPFKEHWKLKEPLPTFKSPGYLGSVSIAHSVLIDTDSSDLKEKRMAHSPILGGRQSGDLPVHLTTEGPSGRRDFPSEFEEVWVWTFTNVTLVNTGDEYLTFHVWLVVKVPDPVTIRELRRNPDAPVSLAPHQTSQESFEFVLDLREFGQETVLNSGKPKKLKLIEAGPKDRTRLVNYETEVTK